MINYAAAILNFLSNFFLMGVYLVALQKSRLTGFEDLRQPSVCVRHRGKWKKMRLYKVKRRGQKLKHMILLRSVGGYRSASSFATAVTTSWSIPPPWTAGTASADIASPCGGCRPRRMNAPNAEKNGKVSPKSTSSSGEGNMPFFYFLKPLKLVVWFLEFVADFHSFLVTWTFTRMFKSSSFWCSELFKHVFLYGTKGWVGWLCFGWLVGCFFPSSEFLGEWTGGIIF